MKNENDYREQSKKDWHPINGSITAEGLMLGATQRIADATEKMASNYTDIQKRLDFYKKWRAESQEEIKTLRKSVAAYKGHIRKLHRQLNK